MGDVIDIKRPPKKKTPPKDDGLKHGKCDMKTCTTIGRLYYNFSSNSWFCKKHFDYARLY